MTQRRYKDHVLISRIDDQCADLPRIFQPDVFPGFATIDGFEDASAVRGVAANCSLASADIYHVMIRWRHCQGTDGRNRCFIEKRNPICAAVSRFPHTPCNRAEIIRVWLTHDTFDCERASTAKRADLSPTHAVEQFFIDCSGWRRGRGTSRLNKSWGNANS